MNLIAYQYFEGVDLMAIEGVSEGLIMTLIAEIGLDLEKQLKHINANATESKKSAINTMDSVLIAIAIISIIIFVSFSLILSNQLTTTINAKIIICSNLNDKKNIVRWFEIWADDYLVKANVTPNEIYERVKKLLKMN